MIINLIIADILRLPIANITEDTSMETQSVWDSLSHMEIIYALENKLAIQFTGDEIVEATSVKKIKYILENIKGINLES